jgi:hypothetical protein
VYIQFELLEPKRDYQKKFSSYKTPVKFTECPNLLLMSFSNCTPLAKLREGAEDG